MRFVSRPLAAIAAVTLAGGLLAQAANAADEPLTGLPFLYDSKGKLIGPYLPNNGGQNIVLVRIDGRFVGLPTNVAGYVNYRYSLSYTGDNCSGDTYMAANTLPTVGIDDGVAYYPAAERMTVTIRSYKNFNPATGETPQCFTIGPVSNTVSKPVKKKLGGLKFTPPFELRATSSE